jgi:hypothetical protein
LRVISSPLSWAFGYHQDAPTGDCAFTAITLDESLGIRGPLKKEELLYNQCDLASMARADEVMQELWSAGDQSSSVRSGIGLPSGHLMSYFQLTDLTRT